MGIQKITEKEIAQELNPAAHVLITQPESQQNGTDQESLRRIPLSILINRFHSESTLCVTVQKSEDGTYSADKPYQELLDAHAAGKTLICLIHDDDVFLPLTGVDGVICFSAVVHKYVYEVVIRSNGQSVTLSKTALGSGGTVTFDTLIGTTDDITPSDVLSAINQGRTIALTHTDAVYGDMVFNSAVWSAAAGNCVVVSTIFEMGEDILCARLIGSCDTDAWAFSTSDIAQLTESGDYPTLLPRREWIGPARSDLTTEVRFVENYAPGSYDLTWDAGVEPGSVTGYMEGTVMTISANGKRKIKMNANSASMFNCFYELKAVKGLEMLDASDVTHFGGLFVYCKKLTSIDMSMWHCGKVTSIGGMFQYCHELRTVKMPHGLNCETLTVTASVFDECYKLREVYMGNGPTTIGDKMFFQCVNLERITGLSAATTIGARAFIYCAKLKDIDLNPAIITSIGESAFRLSSVEDCINMDELNPTCEIGELATRSVRWPDSEVLGTIQSKVIPTVTLTVPHPDSQEKYTDVKFGYKDVPWDSTTDPVDVSIADGGCSALSLYHEWQCIHCGTDQEKENFLHYWEAFEGDNFANINTEENMPDHFPPQAAMLGWGHSETFITGTEQFDVILERLNKRLPTCVIMHSSNKVGSYHALVIVGADAYSRKLLLLDSAVNQFQAEFTWVKFEDVFTMMGPSDNDGDRLVLHTFGDYEGYPSPEYIPAPDQAKVGQIMAVKAVDDQSRPTLWGPVDLPSGGTGATGGDTLKYIKSIKLTEEVSAVKINTDADGNPLNLKRIVVAINTVGGAANENKSNYIFYPGSVAAGAITTRIDNGIYASGASVSSVVDISMIKNGSYLFAYACNSTPKMTWGSYGADATITELNIKAVTDGYTFGVNTIFNVMGVEA